MNLEKTIKTDWASITEAGNGSFILCIGNNGGYDCISFDDLEQIAKALNDRQLQVRRWVVSIPDHLCIVKSLSLPAPNIEEAARMVEFELPSILPLALDEVVYGCTVVAQDGHMLNVLVYVLKAKTLDGFLAPYRSAGIAPCLIIPESLAIQGWLNRQHHEQPSRAVNTLVGPDGGMILSTIEGCLAGAESVHWSEAESEISADTIATRIHARYQELEPTLDLPVSCLLWTSDGQDVGIRQAMETETHRMSKGSFCELSLMENPQLRLMPWSDRNGGLANPVFHETITATGAFDIALTDHYRYANLLPEHEIKKQLSKRQLRHLTTTGGMISVLLLQIFLLLGINNWRIDRQCRAIEAAIAPIQGLAENIDSKRQQIGAVTRQFADRSTILYLFNDLFELTPPAVTLSRLTYEASRAGPALLRIQGQSDTATAIEYPSLLQKARYLKDIKPDRIGEISRPGKTNLAEFQLHCTVEKRNAFNTTSREMP